jgi:hypothetical protein
VTTLRWTPGPTAATVLIRCIALGALCAPLTGPRSAAAIEPRRPEPPARQFVRISPRNPRYLELSGGQPYIPVGFNLVGSPSSNEIERVVAAMASHGVNYCRIWLDLPPWNVEHASSGQFDVDKARELDRFLQLCGTHGIRAKLCVEHFRSILPAAPNPPVRGLNPKVIHHLEQGGFYHDMQDFLTSQRGRTQYKDKLRHYAERYRDEPAVFAWELWNEMNAVRGAWYPWTQEMLPELHRLFPHTLAVQSLGSFDRDATRKQYALLCAIPENDLLQVHRYLDQGAELPICRGPVDLLAADAVAELRALGACKPILLAETGAVKPKHTGASELYAMDRQGMLLHDMLFAPFFAGAAGSGHVWFWREAIDRPNLWHHFQRFHRATAGIDPPAEDFQPLRPEHAQLRIYALRGRTTSLAWCRDRANDWRSELQQGTPPRRLSGLALELAAWAPSAGGLDGARVDVYDPWRECWTAAPLAESTVRLPDFERSLVVCIRRAAAASR